MAFPAIGDYNAGVCPEPHPHAIMSVFFEFFWGTGSVSAADFNRWVYSEGDTVGYGLRKFILTSRKWCCFAFWLLIMCITCGKTEKLGIEKLSLLTISTSRW